MLPDGARRVIGGSASAVAAVSGAARVGGDVRFTIERTWIVGGAWDSNTYIPPMIVALNAGPYSSPDPSTNAWESKAIVDYDWITRQGAFTGMGFKVWHRGQAEPAVATPDGQLLIPVVLQHGDRIRPVPTGSGIDLSIMVAIEHRPGLPDFEP